MTNDTQQDKHMLFNGTLEQAVPVDEKEARWILGRDDFRVACPIKGFSRRRVTACPDCEFFQGMAKRIVIGPVDDSRPELIARQYTVICGHPVARSISYFPED